MGVRLPYVATTAIATTVLAAAAETVACVSAPISPSLENAQVLIHFYVAFHTGTGTNAIFFRVRRGVNTGGTLLYPTTPGVQVAASAFGYVASMYVDSPGVVAGQQWCITLQQNGGTGAGTIDDVCVALLSL